MKAFLTLTMIGKDETYAKTVQIIPNESYVLEASVDKGLQLSASKQAISGIKETNDFPMGLWNKDAPKPRLRLYSRVLVREDNVISGLQGIVINMDFGEHLGEKCVQVKIDKDPTSEGYQVPVSNLIVIY